jgi:hypothetical protein
MTTDYINPDVRIHPCLAGRQAFYPRSKKNPLTLLRFSKTLTAEDYNDKGYDGNEDKTRGDTIDIPAYIFSSAGIIAT